MNPMLQTGVATLMVPTISTHGMVRASLNIAKQQRRGPAPLHTACPECHAPLELHQPDLNQPYRLIGTCSRCLVWVLIDINDRGEMLLTELPKPPR